MMVSVTRVLSILRERDCLDWLMIIPHLVRKRVTLWPDTRPTAFLKTGVRVKGVPQTLSDLYRQLLYTVYAVD
jgi:hypothetical protein